MRGSTIFPAPLRWAPALGLMLLVGCSTQAPQPGFEQRPASVKQELVLLIPASAGDREGWATDITAAFSAQNLPATRENLCSVLAVTEQESTYSGDPVVPNLSGIAREEIERRAAALHVPGFLVQAGLDLESPTGETYNERLNALTTEWEMSEIFEDFIDMAPLGRQLFGSLNPVETGGPMQVSVDFAEEHADDYPYPIDGSIRHEVFTRRGGLYFGIAHLLGYPANYDEPIYRFADFNAGWYASRNAAFQAAVTQLSGIPLALDGDLIIPGSRQAGQTELAVRTLKNRLGMDDGEIRDALEEEDSLEFERTALYEKVYALAEQQEGQPIPYARLPGIKLESPKITRNLTTAWFAKRVDDRWQQCMRR
ncbi:MAG: hypothetical protein CMN25_10200 [Salinicola sp.]|uniref:DUF1615 domain-containing protein n=1 Tax=uncultured Salinicola sp. TaxID=1193542 RepID=UPI000C90A8CD|nr:DUF1615 domain-containing protein [uncultured Salinicola sp.]MAM57694.1 hypothetical protein [Salinicola sp.]|tara:strand:- start:227 stop:1330 length:1104 start_codon:yes stop_codon:yes gene_type:complete